MRVLILDSGNSGAYHAMRSLSRKGHVVHMMSADRSLWFDSKYCAAAHPIAADDFREEQAMIAALVDLLTRHNFELLLFCSDIQAEYIYRNYERVSQQVDCFIPGPRVFDVAFSKAAAYRHAEAIGLPIPRTVIPATVEEVEDMMRTLAYPVVVKGERGTASSHVRLAAHSDELLPMFNAVKELENGAACLPMIQEFVSGAGYVVHALFFEGKPVSVCCHRKLREYPAWGGVTSAAITVDDPALTDYAIAFGRSLDWHGLIKFDFKADDELNDYRFIEMDPRVSASIDITRAAGADQIELLCALTHRQDIGAMVKPRPGVRYCWFLPRDLFCSVTQPKHAFGELADFFSPNVHRDFGFDDWRLSARMAARSVKWSWRMAKSRLEKNSH